MRSAVLSVFLLLAPVQDDPIPGLADRASALDRGVRQAAAKDAEAFARDHGPALQAAARGADPELKVSAQIVQLAAGKLDPLKLLGSPSPRLRLAACQRLVPRREHVDLLLKLIPGAEPALKAAIADALSRLVDPSARAAALEGLDPKPPDAASLMLKNYVTSIWEPDKMRGSFASHLGGAQPELAALAVALSANHPEPDLFSTASAAYLAALRNPKLDAKTRDGLVDVLARECPVELLPLLALPESRERIAATIDALPPDPILVEPLRALLARSDAALKPRVEGWIAKAAGIPGDFAGATRSYDATFPAVFQDRIDAAIRRGAEALRKAQRPDGTWSEHSEHVVGQTGLALFALLKAEIPASDPAVARGLEVLLKRDPEGTYAAGAACCALATALEKARAAKKTTDQAARWSKRLKELADRLVAGQRKSGGWTYALAAGDNARGVTDPAGYDLSNTQFALIGLRAAANAGVKVPAQAWERALGLHDRIRDKATGGWPYQDDAGPDATPTMTAAGCYGWLLCKFSLDEKRDPAGLLAGEEAARTLDYLARAWTFGEYSGTGMATYLLYGVERLCVLGGLEKLGAHDWYREGAAWLVLHQRPDGRWAGNYPGAIDTCFAVLFLKRAVIGRPDVASEGGK